MIQKSTICAGAWQTGRTVTLRTYRGGMRTYRWVLGEANFLSAEWQNIYQLLSCTFLGHRKKLNNDKINVYTIMFSTALRDAVVYYFIIKKTGNDTIIAKLLSPVMTVAVSSWLVPERCLSLTPKRWRMCYGSLRLPVLSHLALLIPGGRHTCVQWLASVHTQTIHVASFLKNQNVL